MSKPELSIVNLPKKIITGITTRTSNSREMNPDTAKIGKLWDRFYQENISGKLVLPESPQLVYGVYTQYESDHLGEYTIMAGIETGTAEQKDPDLLSVNLDSGRYLVFKIKGELPAAIIEAWDFVWLYFETNTNIKRKFTTDFELYAPDETAIYISII